MENHDEAPLSKLSLYDLALQLERFRGEVWKELVRLDSTDASTRSALNLQAVEYERRLSGLNHEADQLKAMQTHYVSVEVYGRDLRESDQRTRKLENLSENWQGRMQLPTIIMAALVAGVVAVLMRLMFH